MKISIRVIPNAKKSRVVEEETVYPPKTDPPLEEKYMSLLRQ